MPGQSKPTANAAATANRERVTLTLPPSLLAEIDAVAQQEDRPRSKIVEIGMRQFVQSYQQRGADPLAKRLAPPTARERAVRGAGRGA